MDESKQPEALSEDEVKRGVKAWLEAAGWQVSVVWGRGRGIDIHATKGNERWVIEAKGCGSLNPMRVNYFVSMLGELHDLALRLVRAADRRTASLAGRPARPERRRTRRPLLLKVEVEDRRGGARLAGHIVDVGLSGCRLELGTSLARGTPVGLQLHAYRESTGIVLAGSVRWTRPDESGMHLVAVRFNGTSAVVARRLFGLPG